MKKDGLALISRELADCHPYNSLIGRLLHGILRFGAAFHRNGLLFKIGDDGVLNDLRTMRRADIIHENRPHPVIERTGLSKRSNVTDRFVKGPEHEIFSFGFIPTKLNGITKQSAAIFRDQLYSPLLQIIAYVLNDTHIP